MEFLGEFEKKNRIIRPFDPYSRCEHTWFQKSSNLNFVSVKELNVQDKNSYICFTCGVIYYNAFDTLKVYSRIPSNLLAKIKKGYEENKEHYRKQTEEREVLKQFRDGLITIPSSDVICEKFHNDWIYFRRIASRDGVIHHICNSCPMYRRKKMRSLPEYFKIPEIIYKKMINLEIF